MARPTKYRKEFAEQAKKLCLLGFTDAELGSFFKVDESTINRWKITHNEFCMSVIGGKEVADAEVAASFYKRACGYRYDESHYEADKKGKLKKNKVIEKEVIPDAGAALNWLKNRQSDRWRDKQEVEHSGSIETLTDEQLDQKLRSLVNAKPE